MRICVLSEYFYPDATGGTGTVLSNLLRQLKNSDPTLEIEVITSKNLFRGAPTALPREEVWEGISITRLKTPAPRQKSVKRRLATNLIFSAAVFGQLLLRRKRYDVILAVTAPPTVPCAANLFQRLTGTPYVYLVYDLYLDMAITLGIVPRDSRMVKVFKNVQGDWLNRAAKVIVLGRCMRDFVEKHYGVAREKLEVAPIPANLRVVNPAPRDTQFRRAHNLSGFLVMYAGNFAKYQDFDTLLDAAKLLSDRPDITFLFVGDGTKHGYIRARIESEGIKNAKMLPFVPEENFSDMMASADVSLVSLEKGVEGLAVPSKFYNILASARPAVVVSHGTSEVARIVDESGCGRHIEPENPAQLAQVLRELADDPAEAASMGRRGRKLCEDNYSVENIARRFHDILHSVGRGQSSVQTTGEARVSPLKPTKPGAPANSSEEERAAKALSPVSRR